MASYSGSSSLDNLLVQSLMGKSQHLFTPDLTQTLEDLLDECDIATDDEDDENKTQLAKEEAKLEKEIVRIILSGNVDSLKPNSGQAITLGEHHICVGFHEENGSDYRVWEWHGHIMAFDEENGYMPEYIYGNYFERLMVKPDSGAIGKSFEKNEEKEDSFCSTGLRELIGTDQSGGGRILHRNMNSDSSLLLPVFPGQPGELV